MSSPLPAVRDPRRILVRGVNWLGDAVMTTPALMRLRERFLEAHIALLTPEKIRELWRHHPAVNEVIPLAPGEGVFSVGRRLRAAGFDLAVILPNSPRSALEAWLARIPQRIGYARPWRNWLLTVRVPPRPEAVRMRKLSVAEINGRNTHPGNHASRLTPHAAAHQIHEYLHLAAALGADPGPLPPQLVVMPDEVDAARKKFGLAGTAPLFGLNPGAEYGSAKRWPAERFIAAAAEIRRRTGCVWLILGGPGDTELAARVAAGLTHHASRTTFGNLAGRTTLRELCALLNECRVLLTNDTGPMHVAAALGTPVVVPFGSTSPELTGPGLPGDPRHRLLKAGVPCSPCFLRECPIDFRCLQGIPGARVVEAVMEAAEG